MSRFKQIYPNQKAFIDPPIEGEIQWIVPDRGRVITIKVRPDANNPKDYVFFGSVSFHGQTFCATHQTLHSKDSAEFVGMEWLYKHLMPTTRFPEFSRDVREQINILTTEAEELVWSENLRRCEQAKYEMKKRKKGGVE